MLGVRKAQELAASTAIAIRAAAEGKSVLATRAATAAQMAFNAVAKANPYVLLGTAIVAVGAALWAFTSRLDEATEAQKKQAAETERLKKRHEEVAQTVGQAVGEQVAKFRVLQKQWGELRTESEKNQFIKENASAFNSLGLSVKSVADAENVLVKMAPQVVAALKAVAEASAFEGLYKDAIIKKATEWDRRTKGHDTGDTYTVYHAGDAISDAEARAAGVRTNSERTSTVSLGGMSSHTSVSNLTKNEIDKVNNYRREQAVKLRKELEKQYDDEINYYSDKWTEAQKNAAQARAQIPANLLGGGGGQTTPAPTPAPTKTEEKPTFAEGSLSDLEHQLSELQKKYKDGLITLTPADYEQKVNDLKAKIEAKKIELGLYIPEDKIGKQLQDLQKKDAKIERSQSFSSFDIAIGNNRPNGARDLSFIQQEMNFNDSLLSQLKELQTAYKELGDAGADGLKKITEEIEKVTGKQKELGITAKQYTDHNKKVEESAQKWQTVGDMVSSAGSAFSSLGSSFEIPALNVAGIIANAIASVIQGYATASAQSATLGPWAWAAFSLAGLAQVASVISQIHSLSGYAEGGVISGGNSLINDDTLIMAHRGEMVLNDDQQGRLFRILNGSFATANNSGASGQVEFVVRGSELYGVLKNYGKLQSSVGRNIGIK